MKILAMDIGAGTIDVLLHVTGESIENSVKMVLPSPTRVYARRVSLSTERGRDLHIGGDIIGGGALTSALKRHLARRLGVSMTGKAAQSIRNDPDEVSQMGIVIKEDSELPDSFEGDRILLEEVSPLRYEEFLRGQEETLLDTDVVAIAVKDHGSAPKGMSSRRFRMSKLMETLKEDPRTVGLAFTDSTVPHYLTRMLSGVQASKRQLPDARVVTMDTSPAAIEGCLMDPSVIGLDPVMAVNVGNGHTMAAIITDDRILGIVEHHTGMLDPGKLGKMLRDLAEGRLTNNAVFEDRGHGALYVKEPPGLDGLEAIAATGPNRSMIEGSGLEYKYAAPGGDMMMTGPIGLVEVVKRLIPR
jgi:uncharacterized protein (DUF1786 family)